MVLIKPEYREDGGNTFDEEMEAAPNLRKWMMKRVILSEEPLAGMLMELEFAARAYGIDPNYCDDLSDLEGGHW